MCWFIPKTTWICVYVYAVSDRNKIFTHLLSGSLFTGFHANTAVYLKAQIMKTKRKLLVKSKALPRRRKDPR